MFDSFSCKNLYKDKPLYVEKSLIIKKKKKNTNKKKKKRKKKTWETKKRQHFGGSLFPHYF